MPYRDSYHSNEIYTSKPSFVYRFNWFAVYFIAIVYILQYNGFGILIVGIKSGILEMCIINTMSILYTHTVCVWYQICSVKFCVVIL